MVLGVNNADIKTTKSEAANLTINGSNNNVSLADSIDTSLTINGNNNKVKAGNGSYDITNSGNSNTIDCKSGDAYIEITENSDDTIINGNQAKVTVLNLGNNTFVNNIDKLIKEVNDIKLQVGINSDSSSQLDISTGILLGRLNFNISNKDFSNLALDKSSSLIETVTKKLTKIGAQYSRLSYTLEENETRSFNIASSKSTLQDADIVDITSEYIRNLILQQSSNILSIVSTDINSQIVQALLPNAN